MFAPRDAIGNHTVAVRKVLRSMGLESEIIAGEVHAGQGALTLRDIDGRKGRALGSPPVMLMYHASTGSAVAEWFAERPEHKLVDYHNISPAEIVGPWEPHIGVELEHGRRQLSELADVTEWAIADSTYNERELTGLGYRRTAVVPILLDTSNFVGNVDEPFLAGLRDGKRGHDWLFVSRLLPHKAQHDVVKAFAAFRRVYDPDARLHLVGAVGSSRYADALLDFVDDLELGASVTFAGSVTAGQLEAYFQVADVYVSCSDHEGFGVPLLEAMAHRVPVVAYACAAVPETAGAGAVLLEDKGPATVAAAVHRVVTDATLRSKLIESGLAQVEHFGLVPSSERMRTVMRTILDELAAT